ncbi:polynucleotide adenylyltransferase [Spongorhabdus nitratireducens]
MEIYLVGGAVRDQLLGVPVKDRDWVVVGATPDQLRKQGFKPVGQDFPVFLHPETSEEYALARTERKSGHGYGGFTFYTAPDVSLEDDLCRRDLTINAIAQSDDGTLFDPFNGQQDLKDRKLRHVSAAFEEDPLRVLRVARFTARFSHLGFTVADETMELMQRMTRSGEVDWLVAERVWQETERALGEVTPSVYFRVLQQVGALEKLMPFIARRIQQAPELLNKLDKAAQAGSSGEVRFALLCSPDADNSKASKKEVTECCRQLKSPQLYLQLAELTAGHWHTWSGLDELSPDNAESFFLLLEKADAIRRPERFESLLQVFEYLASDNESSMLRNKQLLDAVGAVKQVTAQELISQGFKGKELGEQIRKARIAAIQQLVSNI